MYYLSSWVMALLCLLFIALMIIICLYFDLFQNKSQTQFEAPKRNHKFMEPEQQVPKKDDKQNSEVKKSVKSSRGKDRGGRKRKKEEEHYQDSGVHSPALSSNIDSNSKTQEVPTQPSPAKKVVDKPQKEKIKEDNPPKDVVYTFLKISDGQLVEALPSQIPYYRKWEFQGKIYYEFFCDSTKMAKAINNRSVLVEPFCDKDSSSLPYDSASAIKTLVFGELDSSNIIKTKTKIKYI